MSTNVSSNNCFPKFAYRKLTNNTRFLSLFFFSPFSFFVRVVAEETYVLFPLFNNSKLLYFEPVSFSFSLTTHNQSQKMKGENKCSHIKVLLCHEHFLQFICVCVCVSLLAFSWFVQLFYEKLKIKK